MRERPIDYQARTGRGYTPAVRHPGARPLADDEACPTLFRYPGPEVLVEQLARTPGALAPPGAEVVWLSEHPLAAAPASVISFGTLVLLEPLVLSPAVIDGPPRTFVATPRPVDAVVWLPPSRVFDGLDAWDGVRTAADAGALLGDLDDERAAVLERLGSYLEELATLAAAGVPTPEGAWIDVAPGERARLLAARGLAPTFTR